MGDAHFCSGEATHRPAGLGATLSPNPLALPHSPLPTLTLAGTLFHLLLNESESPLPPAPAPLPPSNRPFTASIHIYRPACPFAPICLS